MILVDSSVWIAYFRGAVTAKTEHLQALLEREQLAIGDLILAEVLQGFDRDEEFRLAVHRLRALVTVEIGGLHVAIQAAQNFHTLRGLGVTVRKTIDCLIATRCIESGYQLLHDDRDFDPFVKHLGLRAV